jgi:hypothetical protein
MARFMGTVRGNRGPATRLGHQTLTVRAASYSGAVEVTLYVEDNIDCARIQFCQHTGNGSVYTLYDGPASGAPVGAARRTKII